jgi:putative alpha-1,2-mannosidase
MSEVVAVEFGQAGISNQPSFHIPYLFNYVGQPASAQVVLKQMMLNLFDASPTGYPGDEDNGSMSGWYVFSAMGFYPVCPGSGQYVLGIPLFDEVTLHLPAGGRFKIHAHENAPHANFVRQIKLNDDVHGKLFINHADVMAGGQLDFSLGLAPVHHEYGSDDLPFSMSQPMGDGRDE